MPDFFQDLDSALDSGDPIPALRSFAEELRANGRYDLLFDIRGMIARLELGLPPIWNEPAATFPAELRPKYDYAIFAAARETGESYLNVGNIPAAYRYFRAIGELEPVVAALEDLNPESPPAEQLEDIVAIALHQGLHPRKGLELILDRHGMCRAITAFGMYPVEKDRQASIAMLVRALHREVVECIARTIQQREGAAPEAHSLAALIADRDWLFGEFEYYVDSSHLVSVIPYCLEPADDATLALIDELCEYGRHLSPNFAFKGSPPFEDGYVDYQHYTRAVLGRDVETHLSHFRGKIARDQAAGSPIDSAQLLVMLLARIERYQEALDVFQEFLRNEDQAYLRCPGAIELAHGARNFARMQEIARQRDDVVAYAAARILSGMEPKKATG